MKLSDKIRIIRRARGFTQESLGEKLSRTSQYGISRQSVSDWENEKTEPKLENIRDLADVLQVTFDALLDESLDLEKPEVLSLVLQNKSAPSQEVVNSSFRYKLYYSTRTCKSFRLPFSTFAFIILALVLVSISIILKSWLITVFYGGTACALLLHAILGIIRASLKRDISYIGELNSSHLIIKAYLTAENTIVIPIEKITKLELGKQQKKRYGEIIITVEERSHPVTLVDIVDPKNLVEAFNKISSYQNNNDIIKIF